MSAQPPLPSEKGQLAHPADLEAQHLNLLDNDAGGASLRRQISVQLSAEQFERLYLQPGGAKAKGDLAKVRPFCSRGHWTSVARFPSSLALIVLHT